MNEVLQTLLVYKISAVAYVSKRKFKGELSIAHLKVIPPVVLVYWM
jgi:hypothetical protein